MLRETNLIMAGLFFRSEELRQLDKIKQLLSHEVLSFRTHNLKEICLKVGHLCNINFTTLIFTGGMILQQNGIEVLGG